MFKLHIGCHAGSIVNRDSEVRQFDTLKEAEESYEKSRSFWASIGYMVWFANVHDAKGEIVKTWPGNSYSR